MSQRDLVAELRAAHVAAPVEVRERVRAIAARAPEARKRFTWRRALVVAVPALAAVAAAVVLVPSHGTRRATPQVLERVGAPSASPKAFAHGSATRLAPGASAGRVQQVGTELALRADSPGAVSSGVKRAQATVASLGGYVVSIHASSQGRSATADLTLKVPRVHVQAALSRLSQLGTITGEQLDVQDLTSGINATSREIARLQRQLRDLRAQAQTPVVHRKIASITQRIEALQRATAETKRTAHFATIDLHIATAAAARHVEHHGPFHWLGRAFVWAGIGAVYAFALGAPVVVVLLVVWLAVRAVRRRREDALLSRP